VRRSTVEELARDPVGRYVAGETWLHFCATPTLWGVILWGRPDERHAFELGRSLVKQLRPPAVPHVSIVDASRLEAADPGAFRAAGTYLTRYGEVLAKWLLRVALVRPGGIGGAVIAGAYDVLPRPYPVQVFTEPRPAFTWLAETRLAGDWPADGPRLLADLHADASGTPAVVGALRALLDSRLAGLSLARAAAALRTSERSLQRKLGEAETTFQDELADARVRAAKRLLLDGDAPLTEIAYEVGCASLQHFSALFKKRVRESPSAFRKRHRRG
jgi:AraC-like DNA-binding protein